jgi:uncharacterized ferredoxin-like protein
LGRISASEAQQQAIRLAATLMAAAARTAPKPRGQDSTDTVIRFGFPLTVSGKNPLFDR